MSEAERNQFAKAIGTIRPEQTKAEAVRRLQEARHQLDEVDANLLTDDQWADLLEAKRSISKVERELGQ